MINRVRLLLMAMAMAIATPLVIATPASAATCRDVNVPDTIQVGETTLALNGLGLRKATFLGVKVYVAGLYLAQKSTDAAQILGADQGWRLALHFVRDVEGDDIREAFAEGFDKSTGGKAEPLRPRIDALNAMVPDLKVGDRLVFVHAAGQGIVVEFNDAPKGTVDGADLAAAMLGIWLGPEPPNDDLKTGLLGGACE